MTANNLILVNGKPSTSIDVLDRGLQYGDGVFRTMKAIHGKVRWWDEHYQKLEADCRVLAIPCPGRVLIENEIAQLVAGHSVGVIKIIVTRGVSRRGYGYDADAVPTRAILYAPFTGLENQDIRARWCDLRLAHQSRLAGVKHLNRLENVLARSEWQDPEIAEGLLQDEAGNVICGTMTNLFLVEQGRLVTPNISNCGVAGVTRHLIMRAAQRHGQVVAEEDVSRTRLMAADEVLLCNSLVGIWHVDELEGKRWTGTGYAEKLRSWLDENN